MKAHISRFIVVSTVVAVLWLAAAPAGAQTARDRYTALLARQQAVIGVIAATDPGGPAAARDAAIKRARSVIAGYDALVRRYHGSGYADNALWNAAAVAGALYERFARRADRTLAIHYYNRLVAEYPSSSLVKRVDARRAALASGTGASESPTPASRAPALLSRIERTVLPEAVRVTLTLDREVAYREEKLSGPARVFFDLQDVQTAPELKDVVLRYSDEAVRLIRVGRHPDNVVRVVLDMESVASHSVFTLYNPYRLVVDARPLPGEATARAPAGTEFSAPSALVTPVDTTPPTPPPAPVAPRSNSAGGFSLSRQLGLGVTRIVIDPGHGGHDPGAQGKNLNEADLTLDVALRLEKLLQQDGLDVVLTRRANVYVALEERIAMANRENADLFLSIHANASRNAAARGVETYFLSFASSPEAEAVAARENSASAGGMHNLPDIIKAIALNNKLDESRDFAGMVQEALVTRLRRSNKNLRNLGVKKAPFVVLIGAGMPSVLAEISFLTNRQDLQLLNTNAYKQRIAEALHAAVMRYRRSLKGQGQVAER